jgi:GntR family transcriptional regulator
MAPRGKLSVEPLYLQVRNLLAQRIVGGVWPPGSALPNELDLARELGVSSGTVRKALDSLESDRRVDRRQGRGTFVVDQASGEVAARFSNIRDGEGRRVIGDMELLTQSKEEPTQLERQRLQLDAGDLVLRTARLRRHGSQPFMHEEVALAMGRFPGLSPPDAAGMKIAALAQRHRIHLARASEGVALAQATSQVAKRLGVAASTPLLRLDRTIWASSGHPVEWRVALCSLEAGLHYLADMG